MKKKIYIAGFDVFKQDSIAVGKNYEEICLKYGFEGLYPLDNKVNFNQEKPKIAQDIFDANKKMIEKSDIVVANLNAFRGKEADSGTVWECGFAYALGKKVYGYMDKSTPKEYINSFNEKEKKFVDGKYIDENEFDIEDFSLPINLMIACTTQIIFGSFEDVIKQINPKEIL